MSEPRDTVLDDAPPVEADWDKPTPRVVVPPPDDPYLRGAIEVLNELARFLREKTWRIQGDDGQPRPLTEGEVVDIVQTLRNRVGV